MQIIEKYSLYYKKLVKVLWYRSFYYRGWLRNDCYFVISLIFIEGRGEVYRSYTLFTDYIKTDISNVIVNNLLVFILLSLIYGSNNFLQYYT